jgi:hypothetical protein
MSANVSTNGSRPCIAWKCKRCTQTLGFSEGDRFVARHAGYDILVIASAVKMRCPHCGLASNWRPDFTNGVDKH